MGLGLGWVAEEGNCGLKTSGFIPHAGNSREHSILITHIGLVVGLHSVWDERSGLVDLMIEKTRSLPVEAHPRLHKEDTLVNIFILCELDMALKQAQH